MGLFGGIKKSIGKIVGGVIDVADKVLGKVGIDLKKILDNDWVKIGLTAAAIFTGGVAIANGIMTGYSSASAATGFMNTFVAGAKGFVEGVATGLGSPIDTAKSLWSDASQALSGVSEAASTTGAAQAQNAAPTATDLMASKKVPTLPGGDTYSSTAGIPGTEALPKAAGMAPPPPPPSQGLLGGTFGGADANMLTSDGFSMTGYDPSAVFSGGSFGGGDALAAMGNAGEKGWLESLAGGAKEFASSPMGMMTASNALSGWAQGSMIEERWNEMQKLDKQRRRSWTNLGDQTNTFEIPALQQMRERSKAIAERGNQAQAKYGYG